MGFFSSVGKLAGGLLGAAGGGEKQQSQSGFGLLPQQIQGAYTNLGSSLQNVLGNGIDSAWRYEPLQATAGEQKAMNAINAGFTPTQQSLNADIAMQMNPYDSYVIDEINRQAGGDYSLLKQSLNEAGQMGSNRQMLGANDIDLSRLNQIGGFKQNQFNTSLQNALTTLPGLRSADAMAQMGVGQFQRDLNMQHKQAPISALQSYAQILQALPQTGGQTSSGSSSPGLGSQLGGLGSLASTAGSIASLAGFFSDRKMKENIIPLGEENGWPVYEFNYIGNPTKYVGVMADEVDPSAVVEIDGFKAVDYSKLGVEFREAA